MYQKTNWVDKTPTNSGTPVNADNMNKIEQGIEDVTLQTEQHITDSDIHVAPEDKIEWDKISEVYKGEIYEYQRDDAKESGLYKVRRGLTPGLLNSWLLVSAQTDNGVFIGGEQLFLSASYTDSSRQLQQRRWNKSTNEWGAWENYAYQSDLLPILQDIVELQEEKLNKAEAHQTFANAIIGKAGGETVTLSDVQEGTNARSLVITGEDIEEVHLTVHGKNLWQNDGSLPKTTGGVTVSYDSESGEYILHGTSSSAALNIYIMPTSSPVLTFRKDTQVTLKITRVSGTNSGNIRAIIAKSDFTGAVGAILTSSGSTAQNTATVTTGTQINRMYFYIDASGTVLNNLRLKIQLEIGSTPTAFEPFQGYAEYLKTFDPPLNGSYDITTEQDIPLYSPTSIISTDQGSLEVEYNRDINIALSESSLDPAMFVPRVNQANRVYITNATAQQDTKPISDFAMKVDLGDKLDKTNVANRVYGTNATGNQVAQPTGFFASGATIKVAASNASEKSKASADYVCNGINDRNTLNQAVGDLPSYGGSIELSEGSFNLNAYFELTKHNVTIKGQGHATNIINNTNNLLSVSADNFCIKECRVGVLDIAGSQAVIENCHADVVYVLGDTTMTNCYVSDTLVAIDGSLIPIGNRINTLSISGGTVLPPTAAEIRKLNVVDTITGL